MATVTDLAVLLLPHPLKMETSRPAKRKLKLQMAVFEDTREDTRIDRLRTVALLGVQRIQCRTVSRLLIQADLSRANDILRKRNLWS